MKEQKDRPRKLFKVVGQHRTPIPIRSPEEADGGWVYELEELAERDKLPKAALETIYNTFMTMGKLTPAAPAPLNGEGVIYVPHLVDWMLDDPPKRGERRHVFRVIDSPPENPFAGRLVATIIVESDIRPE